jgi:hypothetical protein
MGIWNTAPGETIGGPRIQFDGRSGEHVAVDRVKANGSFADSKRTLPVGTVLAFDFGTLRTGPLKFGEKPDFSKLRPYGEPQLECDGDYKEGFRLNVYHRQLGVRSFSNNAISTQNVMKRMHDEFLSSAEAARGEIPVYRIEQSTPIFNLAVGSTYYAPSYSLCGWIPRDEAIPAAAGAAAEATAAIQQRAGAAAAGDRGTTAR